MSFWSPPTSEPISGKKETIFVSIPSVILRAIIVFGPVAQFIPQVFDHLLTPPTTEEWANNVYPVFNSICFTHPPDSMTLHLTS